MVVEQGDERAGSEVVGHEELGQQRDTDTRATGMQDRGDLVHREPRADGDERDAPAAIGHGPPREPRLGRVHDAVERRGGRRGCAPAAIAGDNLQGCGSEPGGNEGGIVEAADPDRHVEPFGDEVDAAFGQHDLGGEAGVAGEQGLDDRRHERLAERVRGGDPQQATRLLLFRDRSCRLLREVHDLEAPLGERLSGRCEPHPATRSVDEPRAERILEGRDAPTHGLLGHIEHAAGRGEARRRRDRSKDSHLLERYQSSHPCDAPSDSDGIVRSRPARQGESCRPSNVTVETTIARPRDAVFAYTTVVDNNVVWTSGLLEAHKVTDGPFGVGTRIERVSKFLGRRMTYTIEITAVEPGRRIEMSTTAAPFPLTVHYEYEDAPGGGTVFRIHTFGEPGMFFGLAMPIVTPAVRRSIAHDVATLKDVLEQG